MNNKKFGKFCYSFEDDEDYRWQDASDSQKFDTIEELLEDIKDNDHICEPTIYVFKTRDASKDIKECVKGYDFKQTIRDILGELSFDNDYFQDMFDKHADKIEKQFQYIIFKTISEDEDFEKFTVYDEIDEIDNPNYKEDEANNA